MAWPQTRQCSIFVTINYPGRYGNDWKNEIFEHHRAQGRHWQNDRNLSFQIWDTFGKCSLRAYGSCQSVTVSGDQPLQRGSFDDRQLLWTAGRSFSDKPGTDGYRKGHQNCPGGSGRIPTPGRRKVQTSVRACRNTGPAADHPSVQKSQLWYLRDFEFQVYSLSFRTYRKTVSSEIRKIYLR